MPLTRAHVFGTELMETGHRLKANPFTTPTPVVSGPGTGPYWVILEPTSTEYFQGGPADVAAAAGSNQVLGPFTTLTQAEAAANVAPTPSGAPLTPGIVTPAPSGATSSSGSSTLQYYAQPNFSSQIYNLVWPFTDPSNITTISRGFMIWDKASTGVSGQYPSGTRAAVNFLYNPTTISVTYTTDASDISSSLLYPLPGDNTAPIFGMNQFVSFSLLFDRTYELWNGYSPASAVANFGVNGSEQVNNPSLAGVGADILAMKELTGMMETAQANQANNGGTTAPQEDPQDYGQGVMVPIPTWVFFGNIQGGLRYYGIITEWDLTVTHFTQYMVPMRCTIDVSMQLMLPQATQKGSADPASSAFGADTAWTMGQMGDVSYGPGGANNVVPGAPASFPVSGSPVSGSSS